MSETQRVLVTGGSGFIGQMYARLCNPKYTLRLTYHAHPITSERHEVVQMDLTDLESVRSGMQGMEAVVHMGGDSDPFATWDSILHNNIIGTRNVFEAARLEGVQRIVYGSSNYACAYHIAEHGGVGPETPVRPGAFYGVSKCFGEALGSYYHDAYGMTVICLRIGANHDNSDEPGAEGLGVPLEATHPPYPPDVWLKLWTSNRDMAQLIDLSLETDCGYGVFLASSDNDPGFYDLSETKRVLGYEPKHRIQDYWDFEEGCPRG